MNSKMKLPIVPISPSEYKEVTKLELWITGNPTGQHFYGSFENVLWNISQQFSSGKLAGYCIKDPVDNSVRSMIMYVRRKDTVTIMSIGTYTLHQKRGYATSLLNHMKETFKDCKISLEYQPNVIRLGLSPNELHEWYLKRGFKDSHYDGDSTIMKLA